MTIARYLDQMASKYPDRPAIIFGDKRWTYAEYQSVANRFANAFASAGVGRGDRVAVFHTNCPEHLFSLFAAAKLGAIYSPLNCRLRGGELSHVLTDCEPSIVLAGKRYAEPVGAVTADIEAVKHALVIDASPGEPEALCDTGYLMPHWPKPWGREAGPIEQLVIEEEFAGVKRPNMGISGWNTLTIAQHGTPEQVERWVRPSMQG